MGRTQLKDFISFLLSRRTTGQRIHLSFGLMEDHVAPLFLLSPPKMDHIKCLQARLLSTRTLIPGTKRPTFFTLSNQLGAGSHTAMELLPQRTASSMTLLNPGILLPSLKLGLTDIQTIRASLSTSQASLMVESISHTWLGSSLTTALSLSVGSWLETELPTGNMIP